MWSPYYRNFERESGLINARAGHGIGATWSPIHALGIPIDHTLATPPAQLQNFRVLEAIGSDHRPIAAELSLSRWHHANVARFIEQIRVFAEARRSEPVEKPW